MLLDGTWKFPQTFESSEKSLKKIKAHSRYLTTSNRIKPSDPTQKSLSLLVTPEVGDTLKVRQQLHNFNCALILPTKVSFKRFIPET